METFLDENENKNTHIVGTVTKYNRKIIEYGKINTPNTQIHIHRFVQTLQ